ncbi:MAG: hypothetical protein INQ03_03585 [Candidatus Heimdallarchaeota archaeon]|nr:hypothetical protein [Candidatus Heimdallarchaeota archaeon]
MPNGGSDNCETCPFNETNSGKSGYLRPSGSEAYCILRKLAIEDPLYTYCSNHIHQNPHLYDQPVGPVLVTKKRNPWVDTPITSTHIDFLLYVLANIKEKETFGYPLGETIEITAINTLLKIKERRMIPELKRILRFSLNYQSIDASPNHKVVCSALNAFVNLERENSIAELRGFMKRNSQYNTLDHRLYSEILQCIKLYNFQKGYKLRRELSSFEKINDI